jgi:hypothetical protein
MIILNVMKKLKQAVVVVGQSFFSWRSPTMLAATESGWTPKNNIVYRRKDGHVPTWVGRYTDDI